MGARTAAKGEGEDEAKPSSWHRIEEWIKRIALIAGTVAVLLGIVTTSLGIVGTLRQGEPSSHGEVVLALNWQRKSSELALAMTRAALAMTKAELAMTRLGQGRVDDARMPAQNFGA